MPRTAAGSRSVVLEPSRTAASSACLVAEELVLGQRQADLRAVDALDLADRVRELALERALLGRALLEVAGAELLVGEQLVAGLLAEPPPRPPSASAICVCAVMALSTASAVPLLRSS
jgi:hypothetical protein